MHAALSGTLTQVSKGICSPGEAVHIPVKCKYLPHHKGSHNMKTKPWPGTQEESVISIAKQTA